MLELAQALHGALGVGARSEHGPHWRHQLQVHSGAAEVITGATGAVGLQHAVQGARRVQRDGHVDGRPRTGRHRTGLALAPGASFPTATLPCRVVGMDVEHIGQAAGEEETVAAVALRGAGELALVQFQQGQRGVGDVKSLGDAPEEAAAVVRHQQLRLHRRLAQGHREVLAAAVVDGVVDQFREGVLHHLQHSRRQVEEGREVVPPGQVFLQALERVALHHLAQAAGRVARLTGCAMRMQPLQCHQFVQCQQGLAAADLQALHQVCGQVVTVLDGSTGDPLRERGDVDACHGPTFRRGGQCRRPAAGLEREKQHERPPVSAVSRQIVCPLPDRAGF